MKYTAQDESRAAHSCAIFVTRTLIKSSYKQSGNVLSVLLYFALISHFLNKQTAGLFDKMCQ